MHVLGDYDGRLVKFSPEGVAVATGRLPVVVRSEGAAAARTGYGEERRPVVNAFEATCGGRLLISVGKERVSGYLLDPANYEVQRIVSARVERLGGPHMALCGRYLVALSVAGASATVWRLAR